MSTLSASTRTARRLLTTAVAVPALLLAAAGSGLAGQQAPEQRGYSAGSTIGEHEGKQASPYGPNQAPAGLPGIDVSHYQGTIDWKAVATEADWAYMKATGGTGITDSAFDRNYKGSFDAGLIRGAYHFARPDQSGPAEQARFFVNNGGGWSADGKTLPPMLDIEYNPSGADCYGLNQGQMVDWVRGFSDEIKRLTGRHPVIYTTRDWWSRCTGNSGAFNSTSPLFVACYCDSPNPLPNWPTYTFWQYTSTGRIAGINGDVDEDVFNGDAARLKALATGQGYR